jgi:hypothetical protein
MRVRVDDPWRDMQAVGVDHLLCLVRVDEADLGYAPVLHSHVTAPACQTTAVDNDATHDSKVVSAHLNPSMSTM